MPAEQFQGGPAAAPASTHRSVDVHSRALPMTEEAIRNRNAEAIRGLQALDDMGDEAGQRETLDAL
jgi:hypothetical protein